MTSNNRFSYKICRRVARLAHALVLSAAGMLLISLPTVQAAPSGGNQNVPGLADTPGTKSSITQVDRSLNNAALKIESGLAILDSDVLLKVYYFAYSGKPVDYSAILAQNTQNITPPKPVQPNAAQKQAIDRLIQMAKLHPDVLIKVDDISLADYDPATHSYPINNHLFVSGAGYYFDNSPYHYVYTEAEPFRNLYCVDAKVIALINTANANYQLFTMDIVGHVSGVVAKDRIVTINLRKVMLKGAADSVLIAQSKLDR